MYSLDPQWISLFADAIGVGIDSPVVKEFISGAPPGYIERTNPSVAAMDYRFIATLVSNTFDSSFEDSYPNEASLVVVGDGGAIDYLLVVARDDEAANIGTIRLRRYSHRAVELSSVVHVLDSFGLSLVEDLPLVFFPNASNRSIHIDEFELRWVHQDSRSLSLYDKEDCDRLLKAIAATTGRGEIDSMNTLVLSCRVDINEINLLRALRHYRLQIDSKFDQSQLDEVLISHSRFSEALVRYFKVRFDPSIEDRTNDTDLVLSRVLQCLETVASFDDDQILRGYLELVQSIVRTNYFIRQRWDLPFTLVLKFAAETSADAILRHSMLEIFVYGPEVIGIHLRAGLIARGGIRWSERIEDFRTEIYDLAQAQIKKNSIIIPTGAKGGFVVRGIDNPTKLDIENAYKVFIGSLLCVIDNFEDGQVVTPQKVVSYDGDDHYLVVAADKGTATFSDVANEIAQREEYWLGDAFASGGSHGYDHKAMAITARGAWLSVNRHFAKLDMNSQGEPFRVVGIGDMSGDVFGNGMLQSRSIALIAAFDHRHIFVDPEPVPLVSYNERLRLCKLERSSWADYNPAMISDGGGVWSRNVKEIPLNSKVRSLFGLQSQSVTPPELIRAILSSQVDLIWFGGIGTYIKAKEESDFEVGDSSNDAVRINADQVRSRVIVEGANLGVTQLGRIRYSRRGGKINTDFIDNAGGVAMSDYEVNLKILLKMAIQKDLLEASQRDALLVKVSGEVMLKVLREVNESVMAIDRSSYLNVCDLDAFEALIEYWEASGSFSRGSEFLPSAEEFGKRREANAGLTRPEIAVLQAYAKSRITESIEDSDLVTDASLIELATNYFPDTVSKSFGSVVADHPLKRQLVATQLAGILVNRMGIVWAYERSQELNCIIPEVTSAFWISCKVIDALDIWSQIDQIEAQLDDAAEATIYRSIVDVIDRLVRRHIDIPSGGEGLQQTIERERSYLDEVLGDCDFVDSLGLLSPSLRNALRDEDVSLALSERLVAIQLAPRVIEAGEIASTTRYSLKEVISLGRSVEHSMSMDEILEVISGVPVDVRWVSWQVRSISDELREWRRQVCQKIISSSGQDGLDAAFQKWTAHNKESIRKIEKFLSEIRINSADKMTLVWLIQAEMRKML